MHDAEPNRRCLVEIAGSQQGYFTAAQAKECGYSYALLHHHAARGNFVRLHQGVYRLSEFPPSAREEVIAAWLAAGPEESVVSHESALDLLEISDVIPDSVHITLPRKRRWYRAPRGVTLHTTSRPLFDDAVVRQGIRLTSPVRSIVDSAERGMAPDQVERAVHEVLERGFVSERGLLEQARKRGVRVEQMIRNAVESYEKTEPAPR
jgi:predicted transcriptional regulator of viral defense system